MLHPFFTAVECLLRATDYRYFRIRQGHLSRVMLLFPLSPSNTSQPAPRLTRSIRSQPQWTIKCKDGEPKRQCIRPHQPLILATVYDCIAAAQQLDHKVWNSMVTITYGPQFQMSCGGMWTRSALCLIACHYFIGKPLTTPTVCDARTICNRKAPFYSIPLTLALVHVWPNVF